MMRTGRKTQSPQIRQPGGVSGLPEPAVQPCTGAAGLLLLAHAGLTLAVVLLQRCWPQLDRLVGGHTLQAMVLGGVLMQGGLILLPTVLTILACRLPTLGVTGGKPRSGSLILAFMIGIPAAVLFQGLNNLLIYGLGKGGVALPAPTSTTGFDSGSIFRLSWPVLALVLLTSVVMPGLIEELMFRGVILSALRSGGAVLSAIVWQAAAFALFHADPLFLLPPFLAGLMLAAIRVSSDSLLPAMLAHMSLNFSLLAISPLLPRLTAQYLLSGGSQANSLLYASLIAACVAAVAFVPLLVLIRHQPAQPQESAARLHFWPADWKFALAFLVQIATIILEYA